MNILIINGSPRANGNTSELIAAFKSGLSENVICVQLDLYSVLPMPCIACGDCIEQNVCRFSDLDDAAALLHEADALVWALPVYNYSVPSPVKAFIDRFQRYYEAQEVRGEDVFPKRNRPSVLLLTAGRSGLHSVDIIKKQLSVACSYVGFELCETVFAPHTDRQPIPQEVIELAVQAATRFI